MPRLPDRGVRELLSKIRDEVIRSVELCFRKDAPSNPCVNSEIAKLLAADMHNDKLARRVKVDRGVVAGGFISQPVERNVPHQRPVQCVRTILGQRQPGIQRFGDGIGVILQLDELKRGWHQ